MEELLRRYHEILVRWNRRMNLTAIEGWEAFRDRHVDDSLAVLPHIGEARTLLDMGTGAGIPGLILKLVRPDLDVVLLDSTRKKVSFCSEAIRQLGLTGIRAVWGRAEDRGIIAELGRFDIVISRATWNLTRFLEMAAPFVAPRGRCIAMRGKRWREELDEAASSLRAMPFALSGTYPYRLKGCEGRCLIIFAMER